MSWADVARRTFDLAGHDPSRVTDVTTAEYFADAPKPVAPRPTNSVLDLAKIQSAGFQPQDAGETLADYVRKETVEAQ